MEIDFKRYITQNGETLLYVGAPNFDFLDELALGYGDIWHSGLDQGFKNTFQEIIYQTAVFWWFLNDFNCNETCVSWRMNINSFVIRESVWEKIKFQNIYDSKYMYGFDLAYNLLRNQAGIPLHVKGLYKQETNAISISSEDRYKFYFRNFKNHHAFYMLLRKGIFNLPFEIKSYLRTRKTSKRISKKISSRSLKNIEGKPTVSLVIPTMKRQEFTQILLNDHKTQTYLIKEAVIVDATPETERNPKYYQQKDFPFELKVTWQTSKGSCRARNEAIKRCTGDYIIFADDDIRIQPDFVENHIRLLQTYNAVASNGLDIMAENPKQDLNDLKDRLAKIDKERWHVGVSSMFSNANSCVKRSFIEETLKYNDVNFDGGYGEDADYGLRIFKYGGVVLHNPYSPNLHLKPIEGGYRWWGLESRKKGKERKIQPWEIERKVENIVPVPSPTVTYGVLKHYTRKQVKEWVYKYFFIHLFKGTKSQLPLKLLMLPLKLYQFRLSKIFAKTLLNKGEQYS